MSTGDKREEDLRFAVGNIAFHLLDINLSNRAVLGRSVHVNVHDVFRNGLIESWNCQT